MATYSYSTVQFFVHPTLDTQLFGRSVLSIDFIRKPQCNDLNTRII